MSIVYWWSTRTSPRFPSEQCFVYVGSADLQLYCRSYLSQSPRYEGRCLWLTYNNNDGCGEGCDSNNPTRTFVDRLLEPKMNSKKFGEEHKKAFFLGVVLTSTSRREAKRGQLFFDRSLNSLKTSSFDWNGHLIWCTVGDNNINGHGHLQPPPT